MRRGALLAGSMALAIGASLGSSGSVLAETIQLHVLAAQSPRMLSVGLMSKYMLPEVNKRLKAKGSKYQIKWRESYAGVVAGNKEIFTAIQDRVGDMAQVGTLFEGAKLPLSQMTFYVPFTDARLPTVLDAVSSLDKKVPAVNEAFARYHQRVLSLMGTDSYVLVTKFPVKSIDDLKGHKLGVAGSSANWLRGTGAVPVASNLAAYYNSLRTGVYDGVIVFASALLPFKFYEVAPYITDIGMGAMQSSAITINTEVWKGLPQEVRDVMTEVAQDFRARLAKDAVAEADKALGLAAKKGAKVSKLSPAERKRWADAMPNLAEEWAKRMEAKGLPARELVKGYLAALHEKGAPVARDWAAGWK